MEYASRCGVEDKSESNVESDDGDDDDDIDEDALVSGIFRCGLNCTSPNNIRPTKARVIFKICSQASYHLPRLYRTPYPRCILDFFLTLAMNPLPRTNPSR